MTAQEAQHAPAPTVAGGFPHPDAPRPRHDPDSAGEAARVAAALARLGHAIRQAQEAQARLDATLDRLDALLSRPLPALPRRPRP